MDLLKYSESLKNLPKRFSNLAFWRDCRKFKDVTVNALEYIDSWGKGIEIEQTNQNTKISALETSQKSQDAKISTLESGQTTQDTKISALETSQKSQDTKISTLESGQTTQDTKISALESGQTTQDTKISALENLTYDGNPENFKPNLINLSFISIDKGDGLFIFTPSSLTFDLPQIPHFITIEATCKRYTDAEHKTQSATFISVPFHITMSNGKTRVVPNTFDFYAPYGIVSPSISATIYLIEHK